MVGAVWCVCAGARAQPLEVAGTAEAPYPLGAVPCTRWDDIDIEHGRVRPFEDVTCTSRAGHVLADAVEVEARGALTMQAQDVVLSGESLVAGAADLWMRTEGPAAPWAEDGCAWGASDCNPCVDDVPGAFLAAFDGVSETYYWEYAAWDHYPPADLQPADTFAKPLADSHFQGFAVTTAPGQALTHSRSKHASGPGYLLLVDPDQGLERIYPTWDKHPSGLAVLGRHLVYGDKNAALTGTTGYVLRLFPADTDLAYPAEHAGYLRLPDPGLGKRPAFGGGGAMVKLRSGGYLLMVTFPGGRDDIVPIDNRKFTDVFYLMGEPGFDGPWALGALSPSDPGSLRFALSVEHLGRWELEDDSDPDSPAHKRFDFSENLTLVSECGTGDVYAIHGGSINGNAFKATSYRLSRLDWTPEGPALEPVAWGTVPTNLERCAGRAAAVAWARPDHGLDMFCVEMEANVGEARVHYRRYTAP